MNRGAIEVTHRMSAGSGNCSLLVVRALLASIVVACVSASGCAPGPSANPEASKTPQPLPATPADDRRTLDLILAPFQMPDVRDLKLVVHCLPGSGIRPAPEWPPREAMTAGWLIDSSRTEVRLLVADGETLVFGGEQDDAKSPAPWTSFERHCDPERGSWTTVDFKEALRWPERVGLFNPASSWDAYAVHFAVLAHWAFQRGNEKLGEEFVARLRDLAVADRNYRRPALTWQELLGEEILQHCRRSTNIASRLGAPRKVLLEFWKRFEQSPSPAIAEAAAAMVRGYASLIEEDAKFVERSAEELAAMPPGLRAEYWVYKIRDIDTDVIFEESELAWSEDRIPPKPGNPAWELLTLGKDACPALAAHAKDNRPTRTERRGHPMSFYAGPLMTCGEVCQLVLDSIEQKSLRTK